MIALNKKLVRILVCDDEQSIREVVGMTLREDGWSVEIVENGKKGWELIQSQPFHIVLSDIQMPEMTGMELLEAVKKHNPSIEFVIMTSNATLETALQAIKLGAYDYLNKPFEDLAIVPKKVTQVAEKILLRQQNNELLKRLKRASHDLKRLYTFTHSLNGVLDFEALLGASLEGLPAVFDMANLRCAWFAKDEGLWKLKGQRPEKSGFEVPDSFADLDALKPRAHAQWPLRVELFPNSEEPLFALAFDAPQPMIADLVLDEIRTCFTKVKMHADIVSLANRDGLTRLYNHRYFQDRLGQELAQVKRQSAPLSLILMDVDNFKHFNDTNGHPAGDQLLMDLARILQSEVGKRASDIVARYGGEEFVMALPFTPHDGALVVADRVRQIIEKHPFANREKQPLGFVSVSMGVASFPDHADNQSSLIEAADKALYQSKKTGRNKVTSFKDVSAQLEPSNSLVAKAEPAEPASKESAGSTLSETVTAPTENPRQTLGAVLEATEKEVTVEASVVPSAEAPASEASPSKDLPDVFDVDQLVNSIDAAFFDAAAKAEKIETKRFGPDEVPVEVPSAEASSDDEKKEGHGT